MEALSVFWLVDGEDLVVFWLVDFVLVSRFVFENVPIGLKGRSNVENDIFYKRLKIVLIYVIDHDSRPLKTHETLMLLYKYL